MLAGLLAQTYRGGPREVHTGVGGQRRGPTAGHDRVPAKTDQLILSDSPCIIFQHLHESKLMTTTSSWIHHSWHIIITTASYPCHFSRISYIYHHPYHPSYNVDRQVQDIIVGRKRSRKNQHFPQIRRQPHRQSNSHHRRIVQTKSNNHL